MRDEKWIVPACLLTFFACAVAAWFDDQHGAAYLFLCIVGVCLFLAGYGRYRQISNADSGPLDPSHVWQTTSSTHSGEVETFRYSPGTITFIQVIAWLSTLVAPIIYLISSPRPVGVDLIWLGLFGAAFFACFYLGFLACKAYSVDIQADAIVIHGLIKSRAYNFSSFGKVALLESGGRGAKYVLAMYDKADRVLCQVDTGIDNFEQFVALMKKRSFEKGVPYRYRNMWGSWTSNPK